MDFTDIGRKIRTRREQLGWSQQELADKVGIRQQSLYAIEKNRTQKSRYLPKIAHVLGLDLVDLDISLGPSVEARTSHPLFGEGNLPIFGTVEGGSGVLILSSDPIDTIVRPAPLANVRSSYGVIVTNESMIPVFRPGDIALVNPHLPPHPNEEVVLQCERHGSRFGMIKTFVRSSSHAYHLRQWNPRRDFTRSHKEWPSCHLVIGKYSRW